MNQSVKMKCPLCSEPISQKIKLNDGFYGVLCSVCEVVVTEIKANHDVVAENRANYSNILKRLKMFFFRERELTARFNFIYNFISPNQPAVIAEVGSNLGYFANYLINRGHKVISVELNDSLRDSQKVLFGINSIKEVTLIPDRSVDVFVFLDVIEHIPDLDSILFLVKQKLVIGGIIYLQFPNFNSLTARMRGSQWSWLSAPDHLYHFTPKSAKLLLKKNGFTISKHKTFSPFLDDLSEFRLIKIITRLLWVINIFLPINRIIEWPRGSLIGVMGVMNES